ncbi:3-deoxy-D-manno-octulosonic acid transferase [Pirellulaceae bacterium SH449]
MIYLLNALYLVILFCGSPFIFYRMLRYGRYRRCWSAKFRSCRYLHNLEGPTVWIHAVSVGEIQLIQPFVQKFVEENPNFSIAISTSTDSGFDLARKLYPCHLVFFAPLDFSWAVSRVFSKLNPRLLILAELELWPNLIREAAKRNCPVAIVNGRLSESSLRGYRKISFLIRPTIRSINWIGAQNDIYAERFRGLGIEPSRISVTGNIKFDNAEPLRTSEEVTSRRALLGVQHSDLIWVVGSTQHPEEELMLKAFLELHMEFSNLRLLLVPRHKERFEEVAKRIATLNIPWDRRSRLDGTDDVNPAWRIFLGDSIGELRWWWGLADIGFVGGSFGDRGGQNMIEPCAYGVATSFGPNTKNFRDVVNLLLEERACKQFQDSREIVPWVRDMLTHPAQRNELGQAAAAVAARHRGATERTWSDLSKLLS